MSALPEKVTFEESNNIPKSWDCYQIFWIGDEPFCVGLN